MTILFINLAFFSFLYNLFKNEKIIKVPSRRIPMVENVLTGLIDEKIIKVINLFSKHPEKRFYLSEIARMADVNTATNFRIMNRIVAQDLVVATVMGKARTYQLSKNDKVQSLIGMLRKEESDSLSYFCNRIKTFQRIRLVLLDSKSSNEAKLIIVGDFPSKERLERITQEIFESHRFKINFVEINPNQYKDMKNLGMIGADKKILYRKTSS
jgi:DNA-binding MarR family transcriptional regulator